MVEIGGACLVVGDGPPEKTDFLAVPEVPEPFSALTCIVPLQIFSCL